jgi:hypothetical protein
MLIVVDGIRYAEKRFLFTRFRVREYSRVLMPPLLEPIMTPPEEILRAVRPES